MIRNTLCYIQIFIFNLLVILSKRAAIPLKIEHTNSNKDNQVSYLFVGGFQYSELAQFNIILN
jgi:hypothetical protein